MAAAKPHEAVEVLISVHHPYVDILMESGINLMQLHLLKPLMAGLKVLAAAMVQTGGCRICVVRKSHLEGRGGDGGHPGRVLGGGVGGDTAGAWRETACNGEGARRG